MKKILYREFKIQILMIYIDIIFLLEKNNNKLNI